MTKIIDKLAWLYIQDRKLLVARSKNKNLFYVPGGKREHGESDIQALSREITEEVSVELEHGSIKFANTFIAPADGKENIMVKLTCYFASYIGDLAPDAEIEQIAFMSFQDKSHCSAGSIMILEWLYQQGLIS